MNPTYNQGDLQSLALVKAIAAKLQADPSLIQIAFNNIERWKAQGNEAPVYKEWLGILGNGMEVVCAVLEAETDEGQRLRSSSPFPGVLSEEERMSIWKTHHER